MYIKKEDFSYFEGLNKSLDEVKRKRFLKIMPRSSGKKARAKVKKSR